MPQILSPILSPKEREQVTRKLQVVPNFPRPGLNFTDVSSVIEDPEAFKIVIDAFVKRYKTMKVTAVAGIESRGFIFAAPIALGLGVPFVPIRKPGKLPCCSVGVDFKFGRGFHGKSRLEVREGALGESDNVLIIDDMIGSGSTLMGAAELVRKVGAKVVECACAVELEGLGGRQLTEQKCDVFVLLDNPSLDTPSSMMVDGSG
eukprot:CAMPEP_0181308720 /NCGR_PEP_ID=MMETSP1101-20121128/11625_1 /TAXON_ID=46948 /ORGANISM="Rhodomonas abbreviata, Strain Caron Lab Isolate" /LENGTH=203 /DNA_ID=CAMNT_0023415145 /DNA_START=39 /DNA_END=650 /DNA_ORIENTATION=-